MLNRKIVLLDGRGAGDEDLNPVLDMLINELHETGAAVQTFPLREIKMGSCIGCFGCWLKTPGICLGVIKSDGLGKGRSPKSSRPV